MIRFQKRHVYRNLLRPYTSLTNEHRSGTQPSVLWKRLPGVHIPRDEHYLYSVCVCEISDWNITGHRCFCVPIISTIQNRPAIITHIYLKRNSPEDTSPETNAERLQCVAHELLYASQYPDIVKRHNGIVTAEILRNEVVLPDTTEEVDLICSFFTIARFLRFVHQTWGVEINSIHDFTSFMRTENGQKVAQDNWFSRYQFSTELSAQRLDAYFAFLQTEQKHNFLKESQSNCKASCGSKCTNTANVLKACPPCEFFNELVAYIKLHYGGDHAFDNEFVAHLCESYPE